MSSQQWKTLKNIQKAVKKPTPKKKKDKVKDDTPKLSAKEAFRAFVYDTIKNVFSLSVKEDGDMSVTIDNVFPLMKSLELDTKDEVILDMVHEACIETFGNIDIIELDENIMNQRKRVRGEEFEQDIRSAFRMIDVDNDGFITVPDLYQLMMGIGEMLTDDELMELLVTADHDGDGMVDYKDFKYFLTGELTEDAVEEDKTEETEEQKGEGEEEAKHDKHDEKECGGENEEEKEDESKQKVVLPDEEKPAELTKEEEEERAARELRKRKSLLWAFASQKKEEEKTEPDKPKEETKPKMEPVKDEPTKNKDDSDIKDEPGYITSVSVNIKEKENEPDNKPEQEKDTTGEETKIVPPKRPMSALARRRLLMSMGSLDSGFEQPNNEAQEDGQSDSATDEGFISRTQSAKSRSNFPSRPSTAKSFFGESIAETGDLTQDDDEEKSEKVECDFDEEMNERQKQFLEDGIEQQIYCEAGVERKEEVKDLIKIVDEISDDDSLDLESILDDDPNTITPRINLTRLKSNPKRDKPKFKRSKSAARLRTFKKIENVILCRQNTDPRLNIEHIRAANERLRHEQAKTQKPNSNGMFCTHINIDLNVQTEELPRPRAVSAHSRNRKYTPKPKATVSAQQISSRKLLSRPQTAMTFHEAEKINYVSSRNFDFNFEKSKNERDIKIIDLSNSVSIDTDRFEKPGLSSHHHGYKSVLPLGRVLSGYRNKINQGNGIMLNSISRKLERIEHLTHISKVRQSEMQYMESWRSPPIATPLQKQAVITLELPDNIRQKNCRRYAQSNKTIHRPLVRT